MIIYLNGVTPVLIYRPIQNPFNYYLLTSSPPPPERFGKSCIDYLTSRFVVDYFLLLSYQ